MPTYEGLFVSLRERYLRYRRYGLEPLAADASKEQREILAQIQYGF